MHTNLFNKAETYLSSGFGLHSRSFPEKAIQSLEGEPIQRIYNSFAVGGFLMHSLNTDMRVFQDGRIHAYPSGFIHESYEAAGSIEKWRLLDEKYSFDYLLIDKTEDSIADAIRTDTFTWTLLYEDKLFLTAKKK